MNSVSGINANENSVIGGTGVGANCRTSGSKSFYVEPSLRLNKIMEVVVTIEVESLLLILTTCTEKDALME